MKKTVFLNFLVILVVFGFIGCNGSTSVNGNNGSTSVNGNNGENDEFTVTFNLDGGNISENTVNVMINVDSGTTISNLPTNPSKKGYFFDNWYTQQNGGGTQFTTSTIVTKNLIVYAKWTSKWVNLTLADTTSSDFSPQYRCIDYGNGKWIAGGENGMAWSNDGNTWHVIENMPFTYESDSPCYVSDIIYANNIWIAVANYGKMAWSDDGITWNQIGLATTIFGNDYYSRVETISYGNGKWIAAGRTSGGQEKIMWSDNGVTWSIENSKDFSFGSFPSIVFGDGKWVAVSFRKIFWSDDGETWNEVTSPFSFASETSGSIGGVAYKDGKWIAVTQGGQIAFSENGTDWNLIDTNNYGVLYNISSSDSGWLAVGYTGMYYSSDNGVTWVSIQNFYSTFGGSCFIMDSVFANNKWVVVGGIAGSGGSRIAYCDF